MSHLLYANHLQWTMASLLHANEASFSLVFLPSSLLTVKDREICADPKQHWVKKILQKLNQ